MIDSTHEAEKPALYRNQRCTGSPMFGEKVDDAGRGTTRTSSGKSEVCCVAIVAADFRLHRAFPLPCGKLDAPFTLAQSQGRMQGEPDKLWDDEEGRTEPLDGRTAH